MPAFLIPNRSQMLLLTQVDLSTAAPEGSAVRIIDDLVDSLDTHAIEESYELGSDNGRPPFDCVFFNLSQREPTAVKCQQSDFQKSFRMDLFFTFP
ncbi:MAG: hypothetical protein ABSG63_14075 [Spirochaetia bacterium]